MQLWSKNNNKNYPDFWKEYLELFNTQKSKRSQNEFRFVAFDTETTGFNYEEDRILSIGAVAIKKNRIDISDQLEIYLQQEVFNENTVEIHGIRKNNGLDKISEIKALQLFLEYIGDATLIAHHASFDRTMINKALRRQGLGDLKNRIVDTGTLFKHTKHLVYRTDPRKNYTLDELCNDLKISKSDRHTASGDAYITALAFLKITSKLKKDKKIQDIRELFFLK